jgi:hypothetical protein
MEENQAQVASQNIESQTQPETPTAQPEFSIVDLQNLRAIVDLACKRGTFNGTEMSSVGSVFDRLNAFLNAVAPQQPAKTDEEQAPTA